MTLFFLFFALFLTHASIGPGFFDSGEFIAVADSLGNSHPTGHPTYPLFTKPFLFLPFGNLAFRAHLASAFFLSLFLVFFLSWMRLLLKPFDLKPRWVNLFAISTTVVLALHPSVMLQWTRPEVYPLFYGLLFASLYCLWPREAGEKHRLLGAFLLGLATATQPLLGGCFLLALLLFQGVERRLWKIEMLFFFFGLGVFLYLPFRAMQSPVINWDHPSTLSDLIKVLLAKDFQMFFHAPLSSESLRDLTQGNLFEVFSFFLLPLLILAGFLGWKKLGRTGSSFLLLTFLAALAPYLLKDFYIGNPDSHAYLVPFLAMAILWTMVGLAELSKWLPYKGRKALVLLPLLLMIFPSQSLSVWKQEPEKRSEILSRHLLPLNPGTNLSLMSDHWIFPIWYAQYSEGRRPDVSIQSQAMLRASWYLNQLRALYGNLKRRPEANENRMVTSPPRFTGYLLSDAPGGSSLKKRFRQSCYKNWLDDPFGTERAICSHVEAIPLSYLQGSGQYEELLLEAAEASFFTLVDPQDCQGPTKDLSLPYPLSMELRSTYFIGSPDAARNILASTLFLCGEWGNLEKLASKDASFSSLDAKLLWAWHLSRDLERNEEAVEYLKRAPTLSESEEAFQNLAIATLHLLDGDHQEAHPFLLRAKSVFGPHPVIKRVEAGLSKLKAN